MEDDGDIGDGSELKKDELVKKRDFTTPEEQEKLRKYDAEVEEASRLEKERLEREAEEKRIADEKAREEHAKYMQEKYRKKQQLTPQPFKPSRLIDVETDVTIMNMSEDLLLVKETVEQNERMLWDIQEFLFRKDKKKRESLELKKMKRKVKKR
jgi:hypothetical protein